METELPQTVRMITIQEFAKLQSRYAYCNEYNNYENNLKHDDYIQWYNSMLSFVEGQEWSKYEEQEGAKL